MVNKLPYLLVITLFIAPTLSANQVQTNLLHNSVVLGESLNIEFITYEKGANDPNLQILNKDFEVRHVQKSISTQIVNGKSSTKSLWIVELVPKRTGNIVIPSLRFGNLTSQTKKLQVKQPTKSSQNKNKEADIYLELLSDTNNPYVQQQIGITLRVWMDKGINLRGTLNELKAGGDSIIKKAGQPKTYYKQAKGRQYKVHEDIYLLHPQTSGKLTISPIRLTANYKKGNKRYNINKQSNTLNLNIKPIPDSFTGITWLPAEKINISETWSDSLDSFQVGAPITRTIKLSAHKLLSSHLPEIRYQPVENINIYPGKADLNDQLLKRKAYRNQEFVLIPNQAGSYQLPEIRIPWWNLKTNSISYATLPAKTITAKEAPRGSLIASKPIIEETTIQPSMQSSQSTISNIWLWISIILFCGWIATLILVWKRLLTAKNNESAISAQTIKEKNLSIRKAVKAIEKHCTNNEISASKDAILQWAKLVWQDNPPNTLADIINHCDENAFKEELIKLNKALYSTSNQWNGEALWFISKAYIEKLKSQTGSKTTQKHSQLVKLYQLSK